MLQAVLIFLVTLGVLVVVHEYGHYRAALACGVKVLRFSVGFGRPLWRWRRNADGCEFVVCALPLGGYVRMLDEREGPVDASEVNRAFNRKSLWQRSFVVFAGPAANLILAVALYAVVHWAGVQEPKAVIGSPVAGSLAERAGLRAGDWVRSWSANGTEWRDVKSMTDLRWRLTEAALDRSECHLVVSDRAGRGSRQVRLDLSSLDSSELDATFVRRIGIGAPFSEPVLGDLTSGGPAQAAGLRRGDRVLAVDGGLISDSQALREFIRAAVRQGEPVPMQWRVERAGQVIEVVVSPRVVRAEGKTGPPLVGRVDAMIGQPPEMVTVREDALGGLLRGVERTWDVSVLTLRMIGRMIVGEASLRNLSGPLSIADVGSQSAQRGLGQFLAFLALVSVSLAVLNLLPLPMLDGGHLMYYLFEGVTGRPVPDPWLERLQRGGIALLLLLMAVALFNDVSRLAGLH